MAKKKKDDEIFMEKDVRAWADKQELDQDYVLEKWKSILEDDKYDTIEDEEDRLEEQIKSLKTIVKESQVSIRSVEEIVAVVLGSEDPRTYNADKIKTILEAYEKTGTIPTDNDNRPQIVTGDDGEPQVIAYTNDGRAYQMQVNRSKTIILYGGKEGIEDEWIMFTASASGKVKNEDGEEVWYADVLDLPNGQQVKLNVEASNNYINVSSQPVSSNGFFDVVDDDLDMDEIFDDMEEDYVELEDLEDYVREKPNVPFWTEGRVVSVGDIGQYGNYPLVVMGEPSGSLLDDDEPEHIVVYVPGSVPQNFRKRDTVKIVGRGYVKRDKTVGYNISGVFPDNPISLADDPSVQKKFKAPKKVDKDKVDFLE